MDNKRQHYRTQGRFSDPSERRTYEDKESRSVNGDEQKKSGKKDRTKFKKFDNKKNTVSSPESQSDFRSSSEKSNASGKKSFVYHESADNDDSGWGEQENLPPVVIEEPGITELSDTNHGKSTIFYKPDFMAPEDADYFMGTLHDNINWYDKNIVIRGQEYPQPRLVAWFGPLPYKYSGVTLERQEFPEPLLKIKKNVENVLSRENIHIELNSVLLNLYRNGKDSVSWHSDDEISMGIRPTIASVSLGETRRFEIRSKPCEPGSQNPAEYVVHLTNGSLIVMDGAMQLDWQHRVPKEYHDKKARINLTFRTVYPIEKVPRSQLISQRNFIPPPHPKVCKPFELHGEDFPSLDNASSHSVSKQQPESSVGKKNESHVDDDEEFHECQDSIAESSLPSTHSKLAREESSPQNCDVENFSETQNANVSREEPATSAFANVNKNTWNGTDINKIKAFVPREACASSEGDISSSDEYSHEKQHAYFSNTINHSLRSATGENALSERNIVANLHDNYDIVVDRWEKKFFNRYEKDELTVLMKITENSEQLPIDAITMLSERIGLLINNAKRRKDEGEQQRIFYSHTRFNRNPVRNNQNNAYY